MAIYILLLIKLGTIFICFFLALVVIVATSINALDDVFRRKEKYGISLKENCQIIQYTIHSSLS